MNKDSAVADRTAGDHFIARSVAERLQQARHLIVDLDGTLIREDEVLDGAAALLERFRGRFVIVSNNSTHTAEGVARRLSRLGLKVAPSCIVLAGEESVAYLRRAHPQARILLAGSAALRRHAMACGCQLVKSEADIVLLALDPHFNRARLGLIVNQLRRGARLVATNADASHPGPGGSVVPETGALLAAVVTASGVQPLRVVGKPGPLLLEEGLRRLGASPASTLVIGDNPDTDARGALQLGMDCLLVGGAAGSPSLAGLLRGTVTAPGAAAVAVAKPPERSRPA